MLAIDLKWQMLYDFDFPVDAISKILFLDTLLQPNTKY